MSRNLNISENERKRISEMYGFVNEQGIIRNTVNKVKSKIAGQQAKNDERRKQNRTMKAAQENERQIAQQLSMLESLNNSFLQQISKQQQNIDSLITNKGVNDSLKGVVQQYKQYLTNLASTLQTHVRDAKDPNKRNQNNA